MDVAALLLELYGRIPPLVDRVLDDLDPTLLTRPPSPQNNTIGWLVWHLTRVQDSHIADALDVEQIWMGGDWAERFGLEADPDNTGYAHGPSEMLAVRPAGAEDLVEYLGAVSARTNNLLREVDPAGLDRIVDDGWDPPVTLGVRLASIASDSLQHVGQAAYLRGVLEG